MDAPWSGERVNPIIRALAWIYVMCGIVAFAGVLYVLYLKGFPGFDIMNGSIFGIIAAFYLFLVFFKVAISGHAPRSWIPWR